MPASSTATRPRAVVSMSRPCPHCLAFHDTVVRCRSRDTSDAWQRVTRQQAETVDAVERYAIAADNVRRQQRQ